MYYIRMKRIVTVLLLLFPMFHVVVGGDVIRVMHNNLLNFGNFFDGCTVETNNPDIKTESLKKILAYANPDIFTVNELSTQPVYAKMILDKALNANNDEWAYQVCGANSYGIGNGLFYKKDKFEVVSARVYSIGVRYADIIKMRTKNTVFENQADNVEFTIIIIHLKAGSYPENVTQRGNEAKTLMNYMYNNNIMGNVFLAGDFNLYKASEAAYQQLLFFKEPAFRFYDPIDKYGEWGSNSTFAPYHTQSTRDGYVECFSGGGLDDRFDFILTSDPVIKGVNGMKYVQNTYKALGNDGRHYNKALEASPTNSMYPSDLVEALSNSSDHLPIIADVELKVKFTTIIDELYNGYDFSVSIVNPVHNNIVKITFKNVDLEEYNVNLIDMSGQVIFSKTLTNNGFMNIEIPSTVKRGFYLGVITKINSNIKVTKKIVIK